MRHKTSSSRILFLTALALITGLGGFVVPPPPAGIHTEGGISAEDLVKNVFAEGGVCDNIFNIKRIGNANGVGYFENGSSSIGLDRGIILSTGPISNSHGPNSATDKSGNFYDNTSDQDLHQLTTHAVKDAVGVEFDFIPLDSFVTFRYVFASEEYCEFVGSIYNDVFGFFIRGPGIAGGFSGNAANVALIPGTDDFVAINSVNHIQNSGYYIRNERPEDSGECNIPYQVSPFGQLIEYDGFTTQLTATLRLSPCNTYHIRLVVADVADNYYDSAVFLEAGSFNLGGQVALGSGANVLPGASVYEGCDDGYFVFERAQGQDDDFPLTVHFKVANTSQAHEGTDFAPIPHVVTIPSGQHSVHLPINTLNDGITEGTENLVLVLDIPCACYSDSAKLVILEPPPLIVDLPDAYTCANEPVAMSATVDGGVPPYTYRWSDESTGTSIVADPADGITYWLQVTDGCGHTATDTSNIIVTIPPTASLSGSARICEGDTTYFPMMLTGAPPWTIQYTVNGILQPPVEGINDPNFQFPAYLGGNYQLIDVVDQACNGYASGGALIDLITLNVTGQISPLVCFGDSDAAISVQITGGTPPYHLQWSNGLGSGYTVSGLSAGNYFLSINDQEGCDKVIPFEITEPELLQGIEIDCEQLASGDLLLHATGGMPPYSYSVNGGPLTDASVFQTLEAGQTYQLRIRDAGGCEFQQTLLMPAAYDRMVELPDLLELKLGASLTLQPVLNIPESLVASIEWAPADSLSCSDCLQPELTTLFGGYYTIKVTDVFGCEGFAGVKVLIDHAIDAYIPNAFSPNGDEINDKLTVFANPFQVLEVESLTVYDRWGGMLYEEKQFAPNESRFGWDGTARSKPLDPGIYVYVARLLLVNGATRILTGEVILLR